MVRLGIVVGVLCLAGCAGTKTAEKKESGLKTAELQAPPVKPIPPAAYVDAEHGFSIQRPAAGWDFKPADNLSTEHIAVPLVISNVTKNAQVVVQVAPAIATPAQFAERLNSGLQARAGFTTTDISPIPLADGAVGFDFEAGTDVRGRVAILEGAEGRVFVLLATWPKVADAGVERDVNDIFGSMKPRPAVIPASAPSATP